jgi:DNA mismatch endonuclease (patch repair protein)
MKELIFNLEEITVKPEKSGFCIGDYTRGKPAWNKGIPRTDEEKKKISEGHMGGVSWIKGLTKETDPRVAIISKKLKGRKLSEKQLAWVKSYSESLKGTHLSEERKRILSLHSTKPNKGKHLSEKTKKLLSISKIGKPLPHTPEWNRNIGKSNKGKNTGKKHTEECKIKISIAGKERFKHQKPWNTGKKLTEEHKRKMSIGLKGHIAWNKGIPHTKETIIKLIKYQNSSVGIAHRVERLRMMATNAKNGKITLEIKFKNLVDDLGYEYEIQYPIVGITLADGFVKPNYVFFVDGCYSHACKIHKPLDEEKLKLSRREMGRKKALEKDPEITKKLECLGYVVLRFWEHEINKEPEKVKEKIKMVLGDINTKM